MSHRWIWALLVLPLSAAAAGEIAFSPQQMQTLGISVAPLSRSGTLISTSLPGEVMVPPGQERVLSAPQGGLIDALHAAAGQSVKRGQALAHIASPELVTLQRDYLQAHTQLQLADNMLARERELYQDGIIAERRLLHTQSAHKELTATLGQRRQALKLSGFGDDAIRRLESDGAMSGGLSIFAPIDGTVLEQMATAGQRVDAGAPIYRMARLKPLWLELHAPLEILQFARPGMRLSVPKYGAQGKVVTILRSVNKNDQTVHLRAEIGVGAEKLAPGQFVEAELAADADSLQYSAPRAAVVRRGQEHYLFVQSAGGFIAQPVRLISEHADLAVVAGDLRGTERVAVSGTAAIKAAWIGIGRE